MAPRPVQLLWFVGAAVFVLALFHTFGLKDSSSISEWLPNASGSSAARVSLEEHMRLSEKSWQKSVNQRHMLLSEWEDPMNMPFFPADSVLGYEAHPYSIWDFIPATYTCPHEMERIGRMGDGGKWVCGFSKYEQLPKSKPCIIYSFGVQTESSYEEETLARTHCEIWAYDYSVVDFGKQLNAEHRSRAHFTQAGISGVTDEKNDPPFYSIQDLMAKNGHTYLDILKIDIEYSEFSALQSLNAAFAASAGQEFPIGQILIEIHLFGKNEFDITTGTFLGWWEALEERGMRPVWTEPNLLYTTLRIENDGEPRLAEYTLVNVKNPRNILFHDVGLMKDAPKPKAAGGAK